MYKYQVIFYWIIKLYILKPHKAKDFIKPTADALGYSEKMVEDVTTFYWQKVRHKLSNPTSIAITVANFGIFKIKPWKLDQFIVKYQRIVDHTELDTFQKFAAVKQLEKRKVIIDNLVLQFKEQKLKKQSVKEKRYGKSTDIHSDNLEK